MKLYIKMTKWKDKFKQDARLKQITIKMCKTIEEEEFAVDNFLWDERNMYISFVGLLT